MKEQWKPVVGYEGLYEVSNNGKVRPLQSNGRGEDGMLKQTTDRMTGYMRVRLRKEEGYRTAYVHRLVGEAFISNPDGLPCINHKDEDKTNNRTENLEWCSYKYNSNYGTSVERRKETMKLKKK